MPPPFAAVWHALEAWALPATCLACEAPADTETRLCGPCHALLRPATTTPLPAFSAYGGMVHAAFTYDGACAPLLTRYKFHDDLAAGRGLAALSLPVLRRAPRPEALVPVPLHRQRLRERGHDQALGLARDWGRWLRLPVLADGLRRVRNTRPQTELDAGGRRRNLAAAFSAGGPLPVHVALVDDVVTTGSTAGAAAGVLRCAGVERVDLWVVARAPAPDDERHGPR